MPTPVYLHEKRAFGIWSLPNDTTDRVEQRLSLLISDYQQYIERYKWYGFWNYGDLMHTYDDERGDWRYDVGGFAWDNTELATPMWLWYNFLRTGRSDIFRMAAAMTRHCSEVDTYHIGPWAPLGSRYNVTHWRCGAKEARISQAAFNRFFYYLTTDERTGDLAKGYDPATGRITYDGDPSVRTTNHLFTIMGGFEVMNELLPLTGDKAFEACWLDFARRYKQMAKSKFPVRRLEAYAAWRDRDPKRTADVWDSLWKLSDRASNTNNAALWSLDAIYIQEVLQKNMLDGTAK